jgi:deazaflavin-dependent oxidoreductase (nitroreductase family)
MDRPPTSAPFPADLAAESPRPSLLSRMLLRIARSTSGLSRPLSGRRFLPLWAVVNHRGRRTGRALRAPVAIRATPDSFVIALPFPGAEWPRNVLAAGGCTVRWKGEDHPTTDPVIADASALRWFNPVQRWLLRAARVDRFLVLRR